MTDEKEIILSEIRRLHDELGRPPGRNIFVKATGISSSRVVGRYWASWSDALAEAGFASNEMTRRFDSNELLAALASYMREIGRYPSYNQLKLGKRNGANVANPDVYTTHFGSASGLCKALRNFCSNHQEFANLIPLIPVDQVRERPSSLKSHGHVYLLQSGAHYKIGRSDNLERRIKEISIALPAPTKLVHSIATDDPVGIEAYWHNRFAGQRANGEWFDLSRDDVAAFRRRKFQ